MPTYDALSSTAVTSLVQSQPFVSYLEVDAPTDDDDTMLVLRFSYPCRGPYL